MSAGDEQAGGGRGARRPPPFGRRAAARLAAVQALYELALTGGDVEDVIIDYRNNRPGAAIGADRYAEMDAELFADVVRGVSRRRGEIAPLLRGALNPAWPLQRLETVLRSVLECGSYELLLRPDVPARVIINEYLDVAHDFFSGDEPGLVNAVLDKVAHQVRADEVGQRDHGRPA